MKNAVAEAKQCALAPSYYLDGKLNLKMKELQKMLSGLKNMENPINSIHCIGLDRIGSKPVEYVDY